jgi:cyclophilin family peptidyl-prolyl cis-trans isomerase
MKLHFALTALVLAATSVFVRAEDAVILQLEKKGSLLPPIVIEVFEKDAPRHSANFLKLVRSGFYQNTSIHRILPGALVQMGDPISRGKNAVDLGTGGPGYTLAPEIKRRHETASVGMGRLPDKINPGRLSNGSQFYITLKALPELDGAQTVFGKVTRGMEVLQELQKAPTDTNDTPVERIVVRRSKVVSKDALETSLKSFPAGKLHWWTRLSGYVPRLF